MTTTRGRRDPSLLKEGAPAASTSVADLEAQRQAQLAAVAQVEAAMASSPAEPTEPAEDEELVDLETKEPVGPTPQERYEARVAEMDPSEPRWVVGPRAKNLQVEGHPLKLGDVVPGAHGWQRRSSWESAGYIERA